jgi:hypothetical protein
LDGCSALAYADAPAIVAITVAAANTIFFIGSSTITVEKIIGMGVSFRHPRSFILVIWWNKWSIV